MANVRISWHIPEWHMPRVGVVGRAFVRFVDDNLYYIGVIFIAVAVTMWVVAEMPPPQEWVRQW